MIEGRQTRSKRKVDDERHWRKKIGQRRHVTPKQKEGGREGGREGKPHANERTC